ncbi:MAG: ABC transporter permease [Geminicoccaceae bacterium]|nr:ABC transporter permease [Geminicoccaceae bacterium]
MGLAALRGEPRILPGPMDVLPRLGHELASGELLFHVGATLGRVVAAFVLAMSIGTALGLLMGRHAGVDRWVDPWLVVFLNLPALVVIVLCYLWIGLSEAAAVAAVAINKIPMVTAMLREGARALDPSLDAMARVFRMGRLARLRHVVIPQLAPHLASTARSGLALIWKIVLVVEFLGRSSGVGFKIHLYFQLFDVRMVLTYALAFVIVMLAIETLLMQPVERRARAWRDA